MARKPLWTVQALLVSGLLLVVALAPGAVADHGGDERHITTGEVHLYNVGLEPKACAAVITLWSITLELIGPGDDESVGLSAQGNFLHPFDVAIATTDDPVAHVTVETSHGCLPPTEVFGIDADKTAYDLTFDANH